MHLITFHEYKSKIKCQQYLSRRNKMKNLVSYTNKKKMLKDNKRDPRDLTVHNI